MFFCDKLQHSRSTLRTYTWDLRFRLVPTVSRNAGIKTTSDAKRKKCLFSVYNFLLNFMSLFLHYSILLMSRGGVDLILSFERPWVQTLECTREFLLNLSAIIPLDLSGLLYSYNYVCCILYNANYNLTTTLRSYYINKALLFLTETCIELSRTRFIYLTIFLESKL